MKREVKPKMISHREMGKKNITLLVLLILSYCAEYCFNVVLARHLSISDYGIMLLILRVCFILVPVVLLGLDTSIISFLPPLLSSNKNQKALEFMASIALFLSRIFFRIIFIAITACFFIYIYDIPTTEYFRFPLVVICFLIPGIAISSLLNKIFICYKKPVSSVLIFEVVRFIVLSLLIYGEFYLRPYASFYNVVKVLFLGYLFIIALQSIFLKPLIDKRLLRLNKSKKDNSWIPISLIYMLNSLAYLVFSSIDLLMLILLHKNEAVGQFGAILVIGSFLIVCPKAIGVIISPIVSTYSKEGDYCNLKLLIKMSLKFSVLLSFVGLLGLLCCGTFLLSFFGEGYGSLHLELCVMSFVFFIICIIDCLSKIMSYSGHHLTLAKVNASGIIFAVAINLAITPKLGLWGAIISFSMVNLIKILIVSYITRRDLMT